ncbi:MAG: YbhB/YbcL family Raf kinase inhibitor-like protein [Candidatus Saccharibacteria bacterium]
MRISSTDFQDGQAIPSRFACDGENVNPTLKFEGVPPGAKSLVIMLEDPDAPNGTFTHWMAYDMLPDTVEILTGMEAPGVGLLNGTGKPGYMGPCPPEGTHRYFFRLFALDATLAGDKIGSRADLEKAMEGHIMETAELMGTYKKSNP